jgi:hypothetical protein
VLVDRLFRATNGPTSSIAHHADRLPVQSEVRPCVCATLAAGRAGETVLNIRQPNVIRPAIAADRDGVAAAVVGAMDEQPTHALSRISAKVIFCGRLVMACASGGSDTD